MVCGSGIRYTRPMGLFWKDIEIQAGMLLEVEDRFFSPSPGEGVQQLPPGTKVQWKIIDIRKKKTGEAYYETSSGRTYSLSVVMRRSRLRKKESAGELLQIPACTDYLAVEVFHQGTSTGLRCFSLDMLSRLRAVKILQ